jgi:hypothetical protein
MPRLVPLLALSLASLACSPSKPPAESKTEDATRPAADKAPKAPDVAPSQPAASEEPSPKIEAPIEPEREPPGPGVLGAPHEYLIDEETEVVLADGTVRKTARRGWKMIVEPRKGGLRVRYVVGDNEPAATAFEQQLYLAWRELSLELDAKGRLTSVAGRDAFHDRLADDPEFGGRELLERVWDTNEGLFSQSFRLLFLPFVGVEFPRDGSPLTSTEDGVTRVTSAEALDGADAGKMRFLHAVEGPAPKTAVAKPMYFDLCGLDFDPMRLDDATGRWQVELIADPDTMAPSRATVTIELSRSEDGQMKRARSVATISFR